MIRYITRHGQVVSHDESHLYTTGDMPLSQLGREQAKLLGKRLAKAKFNGHIISSPFLRTLETAELIAEETGSLIFPYGPIHEIIASDSFIKKYEPLSYEELRSRFPHISENSILEYPWMPEKGETSDDVLVRVSRGVAKIEMLFPDVPLLYVGHGASAGKLLGIYEIPSQKTATLFNCSLSAIDPGNLSFKPIYCDTSHIPYEMTTSNFVTKEQWCEEKLSQPYEAEVSLPEEYEALSGPRVLHIGDTNSYFYGYYKKLIEAVKPDVIIHTGDMADEVKVGNCPNIRGEYLHKIKIITDMMNKSGARLVFCSGNNDLMDEVKLLCHTAEIYEENDVVDIFGTECRIGHYVTKMTFDKELAFYGHSTADDHWKKTFNCEGLPCRFSAMWGSTVYFPDHKKFCHFKRV